MAASAGRQITLNWGNTSPPTEIGGLREKGVEMNGEPIDITSDDDDGWRKLLSIPAQNEVTISISGVTKDNTLKNAWFTGARTEDVVITLADGSTLTGEFMLTSYTETGTYNEATVFEGELQSSGVITFVDGSP